MSTKEIWKTIAGYEGFYEVSNEGRIRSVDRYVEYRHLGESRRKFLRGRILKCSVGTTGYLTVSLSKGSKPQPFAVHRLVASAFVGGQTEDRSHVDHIDGNKENNDAENLRWCSNRENHNFELARQRGSKGQKNSRICRDRLERIHRENQKPVMCVESKRIYASMTEAAKDLGVTKQAVKAAIDGHWKCRGFHFVFV